MDPIDVIGQDLLSSETHVRIKCISHFPLVAKVIGPQDTQKRLLPLIFKHCFPESKALTHDVQEEDIKEIALVLNKEFLINAGGEEYCEKQFEFLEKASSAEETVVRKTAAESLSSCISALSPEKNSKIGITVFKRLCESNEWPNRITSATIAASLYEHLNNPEQRAQIVDSFKLLIRDEMPLVRAQAFKDLPSLIAVCDESFYSSHCRLFLHHLTNEVSPSQANLEIINIAISLLREHSKRNVSSEQLLARTWPWFEKAGESDSWRLRNAFIRKVPEICELYDKMELRQVNSENILPVCLKILVDPEPQVREIALEKFVKAAPFMDCSPYKESLLEKITALSEDMNQTVKENCSSHVIDFFVECKLTDDLGKLISIINNLDTGGNPQFPTVITNLCSKLGKLFEVVEGTDNKSHVEDCVKKWFEHRTWRIRHALVSSLGIISKSYAKAETFPFLDIIKNAFTDSACQVRVEACKQLPDIFQNLGKNAAQELIDVCQSHTSALNYHHRLIICHVIDAFSEKSTTEFDSQFQTMCIERLQDAIVNVKIAACISIQKSVGKWAGSSQLSDVEAQLEKMKTCDEDPDLLIEVDRSLNALIESM